MPDTPAPASGNATPSLDVSGFLKAIDIFGSGVTSALADLDNTMTGYKSAIVAQQPEIEKKNAAESDIVLFDIAHKERVRAATAEAASWFGTNKEANSFVLAGLGEELLSRRKDILARREDIQKRKDSGFLDNPLDFILNQITTPFAEEALAFAEATQAQEEQTAAELMRRTSEAAAINSAIVEGDAEGRANAVRKALVAKTAIEVQQSNERLAALGLQGINVRQALNKTQFEIASAATNIQAKMIELNLSQKAADRADQSLEIQKETAAQMKEIHQLQINAANGNQLSKDELQSKLNAAAAVVGMQPPDANSFQKLSTRQKEFWNNLIANPTVQEGFLGYNVGQALQYVEENSIPLGTPGMRMTYDKLSAVREATISKYSSVATNTPWAQLTKDARAVKIKEALDAELKREAANIKDAGDIFSPPPAQSVLKIPAVASTEIAKVLIPIAKDPNMPFRAQDVLSAAIMKMQGDQVSPEQLASEISQIYRSIIMDNNQQRQYGRFAITPMSPEAGFRTQVSIPDGFLGIEGFSSDSAAVPTTKIQTVNMANEAQLSTLLTRIKISTIKNLPVAPNAAPAEETAAEPPKKPALTPYGSGNRFDPALNSR